MPADLPASAFHLFSDLPPELRILIWEYCLPQRVREVNEIVDLDVWIWIVPGSHWPRRDPRPCSLKWTARANISLPFIAQVCQESRRFALSVASIKATPVQSDHAMQSGWDRATPWIYHPREIPHLYHTPVTGSSSLIYSTAVDDDPLKTLYTAIVSRSGFGSFMFAQLTTNTSEGDTNQYDYTQYDEMPGDDEPPRIGIPDPAQYPILCKHIRTLQQRTNWLCVIEVVIVHATHDVARATGLFGLLGDAPIQIIDIFDTASIALLWYMAELAKRSAHAECKQMLNREAPETWQSWLRRTLWCGRYPNGLRCRMRPAIMFRLCTQMCNRA